MKEPTQEELHKIAPYCNMMFALAIVLEGLTLEENKTEIYDLACEIRSKVNEYVPDVAIEFGNWSDDIEKEILSVDAKTDDVINWIIAKIYALKNELNKMYRVYDRTFVLEQESAVNSLKMLQNNFDPKIAKKFNEIIKRLMEE